jgi:cytoskeletal protein RodZ
MSFFQNLFSSKMKILTFVVLPIFIILLIAAWIYMIFFANSTTTLQEQSASSVVEIGSIQDFVTNKSTQISSSKSTTKASFDDLEKPKSTTNSQSSIVALTSSVASTPEIDATEIMTLLDKIELLDSNEDATLDNQILEN